MGCTLDPIKIDLLWTTGFVSWKDFTFFCWSHQLQRAHTHIHKAGSLPKHSKIIPLIKVSHLYHLMYKLYFIRSIKKRLYFKYQSEFSYFELRWYFGILFWHCRRNGMCVFDLFISLDLWIIYSYWHWQTPKSCENINFGTKLIQFGLIFICTF